MKNVAVMGFGNVGSYAAKAVLLAPYMRLCGIISDKEDARKNIDGVQIVSTVDDLSVKPDGVLVCLPSRKTKAAVKQLLSLGINTADACDLHTELPIIKRELHETAIHNGAVAVLGAGWDPGLDSYIRALMAAALPLGETVTSFGPGVSMGHTAAVKAVCGVEDAVSLTIPKKSGGHRRLVYVKLKPNADMSTVEHAILHDGYFEHDSTKVTFVDDVSSYKSRAHAVKIVRSGCTFDGEKQLLKYEMSINNPALTAQIMLAALRAGFNRRPGCCLFPELSPAELFSEFEQNGIL